MTSEARPRQRPIVNPEHLHAALRRIVSAWNDDHTPELIAALTDAGKLLGVATHGPGGGKVSAPTPAVTSPFPVKVDPPIFDPLTFYGHALSAQPCGCDEGAGHKCGEHR